MSKVLTVKQVSKKLKVSGGTVYGMIERGTLKKVNDTGRIIRISEDELKRFISNVGNEPSLEHDKDKVVICETHIGKVRKLKNEDWFVLKDICRLLQKNDTYTIKRAVSENATKLITIDEASALGIRTNSTGLLLITYAGINEYSLKTRTVIDWNRFLDELIDGELQGSNQEYVQECMELQENKNNNLKIFEGQEVEVIELNGEPLFELYSTGMALGYVTSPNSKGTCYPHRTRIDKIIENGSISTCLHGVSKYLTEESLYDFMLEAKTAKCKAFRKWVTSDVLPTIRKTGGYVNNSNKFVDNYFSNLSIETKNIIMTELENKNRGLKVEKDKIEIEIATNTKVIEEIRESFK